MYYVTKEEIAKLDQLAVDHGLQVRQMMELAGFYIRTVFAEAHISTSQSVLVLVGPGNKGGDGLASARQLRNMGYSVSVLLMEDSSGLSEDAEHQRLLLEKMEIPLYYGKDVSETWLTEFLSEWAVVIDALVGYNIEGALYGPIQKAVQALETYNPWTVSYDVPTGLHASRGVEHEPVVTAEVTLSLASPKKGFRTEQGAKHTGTLYVGDLGIPRFLYDMVAEGSQPSFSFDGLVRVNKS